MLNKIWAGLIILSILFALGQDLADEVYNSHHNNAAVQLQYTVDKHQQDKLIISYDSQPIVAEFITNQLIKLYVNEDSPQIFIDRSLAHGNKQYIVANIVTRTASELDLILPSLHWRKLRSISHAAFDMAEFAVKLALGLVGVMALWLGLMRIAEQSGLINYLVKAVQPVLHWLFPGIPKDHPVLGSISMNMAANILGLGNAATPLGIKAMQQLQTLNRNKDQASDEMCMFLALNTSSVQLLPPVTLIALMGTQISELLIPIILATSCSTIVAVAVAKLYARKSSV